MSNLETGLMRTENRKAATASDRREAPCIAELPRKASQKTLLSGVTEPGTRQRSGAENHKLTLYLFELESRKVPDITGPETMGRAGPDGKCC